MKTSIRSCKNCGGEHAMTVAGEAMHDELRVPCAASPVQGAASITDLVQAKQGEPARRMVELTQGAASAPPIYPYDKGTAASATDPVAETLIKAGYSDAEAVALAAESRARLAAEATLSPCPFCGAQATFLRSRISCDSCLCDVHRATKESDAELANSWNRRAALAERAQAAQPDAIESLNLAAIWIENIKPEELEIWRAVKVSEIRRDIRALAATPAPEQEAAPKSKRFEAWWEEHGQFVRAGGGDYEKCFAYAAWNYVAPVEQEAAQVVAKAEPTLTAILNCYSPDDTVGDYQDKIRALFANDLSHVVPPFAAPAGQHDAGASALAMQRDMAEAKYDNAMKVLMAIFSIAPKSNDIHLPDGRVLRFNDPNASETLSAIGRAIWSIPERLNEVLASGAREGRDAQDESSGEGCATATNTNQPATCWSCNLFYTEAERAAADGDCPNCGAEVNQPENLGAANTNKGGEAK